MRKSGLAPDVTDPFRSMRRVRWRSELCRKHGMSDADLLQMESQVAAFRFPMSGG